MKANNFSEKSTAVFSVELAEIERVLYALAFAKRWSADVYGYEAKKYESLYIDLYEGAVEAFGKERVDECCCADINDVETIRR